MYYFSENKRIAIMTLTLLYCKLIIVNLLISQNIRFFIFISDDPVFIPELINSFPVWIALYIYQVLRLLSQIYFKNDLH